MCSRSADSSTSTPSARKTFSISSDTSGSSRPTSRAPCSTHRDTAPEMVVRLSKLETDVATAQHDQMFGKPVKIERLDVGERVNISQSWHRRNAGVRAGIQEQFPGNIAARPAVVQCYLHGLRRHQARGPHDQLGATRLVALQVKGVEALNHVALVSTPSPCPRRWGRRSRRTNRRATPCGLCSRAPDFVLAG